MSHTVGEKAALAVKNSERRKIQESRTPDEIIKTLRNNLTNPLAILKSDVAVLMSAYDDQKSLVSAQLTTIETLTTAVNDATNQITILQAQLEQFRVVYEKENELHTLILEEVVPDAPEVQQAKGE